MLVSLTVRTFPEIVLGAKHEFQNTYEAWSSLWAERCNSKGLRVPST